MKKFVAKSSRQWRCPLESAQTTSLTQFDLPNQLNRTENTWQPMPGHPRVQKQPNENNKASSNPEAHGDKKRKEKKRGKFNRQWRSPLESVTTTKVENEIEIHNKQTLGSQCPGAHGFKNNQMKTKRPAGMKQVATVAMPTDTATSKCLLLSK